MTLKLARTFTNSTLITLFEGKYPEIEIFILKYIQNIMGKFLQIRDFGILK